MKLISASSRERGPPQCHGDAVRHRLGREGPARGPAATCLHGGATSRDAISREVMDRPLPMASRGRHESDKLLVRDAFRSEYGKRGAPDEPRSPAPSAPPLRRWRAPSSLPFTLELSLMDIHFETDRFPF